MASVDRELRDKIPTFEKAGAADVGNWSSAASTLSILKGSRDVTLILVTAIIVFGGAELLLRLFEVPAYIAPTPSQVVWALITDFPYIGPHIGYTLIELSIVVAILGIILGGMVDQNLRRMLQLIDRDPTQIFTRPIALVLIAICLAAIFMGTSKRSEARIPSVSREAD